MDLGAVLRRARHEAGLSQAVVAELAGVTRHSLSRWENGARPVRSDDADRVLAACERDVRFRLVDRHADVDDVLEQLAALPVAGRLTQVRTVLMPAILEALQATGGVVFTGAWAAAALGLPPLHQTGGFLLGPAAADHQAVVAVLGRWNPISLAPGGPWSVTWNDQVFARHPSERWHAALLGEFMSEIASDPVPELRLATGSGPWRVIEPSLLVPEDVDQLVLDRWRARRAT